MDGAKHQQPTVSIHTRHFWRVNSVVVKGHQYSLNGFNPHPPFLAGELTCGWWCWMYPRSFNPHPPFLAGELLDGSDDHLGHLVSIHTRHFWRVNCRWHLRLLRRQTCFNPHPPFLAGEFIWPRCSADSYQVSIHTRHFWRVNLTARCTRRPAITFQSTPAISGG